MNRSIRKLLGTMRQDKQRPGAVEPRPLPVRTAGEWQAYWQSQGQPWRTEPEIDVMRQEELAKSRLTVPDIGEGIYPFKKVKLSRADVEWLLATHEGGRGPVDWNNESQRAREGLDLRGADLRDVDLKHLPMARLRGALTWQEQPYLTEERRQEAVILLEGADLKYAHLEGAILADVRLKKVDLRAVHFAYAYLVRTHLEGVSLEDAHLERANLLAAYLEDTFLGGVVLADEHHIGPRLLGVHWEKTDLGDVNWTQVRILDDEYRARQKKREQRVKEKKRRMLEYERAVLANRQLALALQSQGLNEDAARFAYRAQILQKTVLWFHLTHRHVRFRQRMRTGGGWFFSWFLYLLTGYGYRMWRILAAYLLIVSLCAGVYFVLGMSYPPHVSLLQALLESITAFHGRVFSEVFASDTPQIWVTAFEAVAGLVIEGVFIAMLTQRFFGK